MSLTKVSDNMRDTTTLDATKLSGNLPAISGASLTGVGKVLQVVFDSTTSGTSHSTSTFVDVGLSVSITPSSTSSKIYISGSANANKNGAFGIQFSVKLLRDSTTLLTVSDVPRSQDNYNGFDAHGVAIAYLDSPSSTSALTYKIQMNCPGSNTHGLGVFSYITAMEIAN